MAGDLCSEMFFAVGLEIFCAIHNLELVVKSAQLCQYVQTVILCTENQTLFTKPELLCHSLILIQTQTHICLVDNCLFKYQISVLILAQIMFVLLNRSQQNCA